jgi:uncharacterized protein (DUF2141 family)
LFDFTRQAGFIVTIQHDEDGLRLVATTPCSIPAEAFAEARHIVDNRVETEKITLGRPAQKICNLIARPIGHAITANRRA